ncbi:MAG: ROK family protein, partial [Deltaproteobacteria bacterium]|nr:ROK family protein [Deltaproteobacteria bacterium]
SLSFLSVPWIVENDANSALLGEAWLGEGQKESSFCCLTLGTGIGSGLFLNGKLWKGVRGMASEMGHLKIDFSGKTPCSCGGHGCLEAFASASALHKKTGYSGEELYQKAGQGDSLALHAFEEMGAFLGRGIGSVANLLNIDLFILAGQLSQAFHFFYPSCHRGAQESAMKGPRQHLKIVQSKLGDDAGLLGAAYAWLQKHAR